MAKDGSRRRHTAYDYTSGNLDGARSVSERIGHESRATDHMSHVGMTAHVLSVVCVATTQ